MWNFKIEFYTIFRDKNLQDLLTQEIVLKMLTKSRPQKYMKFV